MASCAFNADDVLNVFGQCLQIWFLVSLWTIWCSFTECSLAKALPVQQRSS